MSLGVAFKREMECNNWILRIFKNEETHGIGYITGMSDDDSQAFASKVAFTYAFMFEIEVEWGLIEIAPENEGIILYTVQAFRAVGLNIFEFKKVVLLDPPIGRPVIRGEKIAK